MEICLSAKEGNWNHKGNKFRRTFGCDFGYLSVRLGPFVFQAEKGELPNLVTHAHIFPRPKGSEIGFDLLNLDQRKKAFESLFRIREYVLGLK